MGRIAVIRVIFHERGLVENQGVERAAARLVGCRQRHDASRTVKALDLGFQRVHLRRERIAFQEVTHTAQELD